MSWQKRRAKPARFPEADLVPTVRDTVASGGVVACGSRPCARARETDEVERLEHEGRRSVAAVAPPAVTAAPPPVAESTSPDALLVAGGVLTALGAASLVAGAVTGGLTLTQAEEITAKCDGVRCPDRLEDDAEQAKLLGHVSTGTLVAGGAVAAVGMVLLIIGASSSGESPPEASGLRVDLVPAAGGLALRF